MLMTDILFRRCLERGATATEYAILAAMVATIVIAGVLVFGTAVSSFLGSLGATVSGWATNGLT